MIDSNSKYDLIDLLPESVGVIKTLDGKEISWDINRGVLSNIEKELFKTGTKIITLKNYKRNRIEYNQIRENAEIREGVPVIVYFYKTEEKEDERARE